MQTKNAFLQVQNLSKSYGANSHQFLMASISKSTGVNLFVSLVILDVEKRLS